MTLRTTPFDASKYLTTKEDHLYLLNDAFQSGSVSYIATAVGVVARSFGMTKLSRKTGHNRSSLYRTLSNKGNPTFSLLISVLRAMGFKLGAKSVA